MGADIEFTEIGDKVAIKYPKYQAEKIDKALDENRKGIAESDRYLISIKDNSTVTFDIKSLLKEETADSYMMRIPGTNGEEYIRLDKSVCELINDGKSVQTKLDPPASYTIYDKEGNIKGEKDGSYLSGHFDQKTFVTDKDTKHVIMPGASAGRIELFSKEDNKLISIGLDDAKEMRAKLINIAGISPKAVDNLLREVDEQLKDRPELQEKFNFVREQVEPVYVPIPNIENDIAQTYIAETVLNKAQFVGEAGIKPESMGKGPAFMVYNKVTNTYTMANIESLKASLKAMGFGMVMEKYIENKISDASAHASYDGEVKKFEPQTEVISGLADLDR